MVLFRTRKFLPTNEDVTAAAIMVWDACGEELGLFEGGKNEMERSEFIRIYGSVISGELSKLRQYVQTRTQSVMTGKPHIGQLDLIKPFAPKMWPHPVLVFASLL